MSRLGERDRCLHRLEITHLTDHDDIRILTQYGSDSFTEGMKLLPEFSLVDEGIAVLIDEFDRILERDDMFGTIRVDIVEDRGHGGGFP